MSDIFSAGSVWLSNRLHKIFDDANRGAMARKQQRFLDMILERRCSISRLRGALLREDRDLAKSSETYFQENLDELFSISLKHGVDYIVKILNKKSYGLYRFDFDGEDNFAGMQLIAAAKMRNHIENNKIPMKWGNDELILVHLKALVALNDFARSTVKEFEINSSSGSQPLSQELINYGASLQERLPKLSISCFLSANSPANRQFVVV